MVDSSFPSILSQNGDNGVSGWRKLGQTGHFRPFFFAENRNIKDKLMTKGLKNLVMWSTGQWTSRRTGGQTDKFAASNKQQASKQALGKIPRFYSCCFKMKLVFLHMYCHVKDQHCAFAF